MKAAKPTTATIKSVTMNLEANQSSSLPLSSMTCMALIHTTSRISPTTSTLARTPGVSLGLSSRQEKKATTKAKGTLT